MPHGDFTALRKLQLAAHVGRGDDLGRIDRQRLELAGAQPAGESRLQHRIGSCRTAAEVCILDPADIVTATGEQFFHPLVDTETVLHGAGRMHGNPTRGPFRHRRVFDFGFDDFEQIPVKLADPGRLVGVIRITRQQATVIPDADAAAGGTDDDGLDPGLDMRPAVVDQSLHLR